MAIKPTKRLLRANDPNRPNLISKQLLSGDVQAEDCPWVKIGNLYLSLTIVGENSWLPLIALLRGTAAGQRSRYAVFTGRHGGIPNLVNEAGETLGVFDADFVAQDEAVRRLAIKAFPDVQISLVDTGTNKRLQAKWLRDETTRRINGGEIVIYAWCYGLFTFCELNSDRVGTTGPEALKRLHRESHNHRETSRSVKELVDDHWFWVPRPIT